MSTNMNLTTGAEARSI